MFAPDPSTGAIAAVAGRAWRASASRIEQDEDDGGKGGDEYEPHEDAANVLPLQSRPMIQGRRADAFEIHGIEPPVRLSVRISRSTRR